MTKQVLVLMIFLCMTAATALGQKADVGLVLGASFSSDSGLAPFCPTIPCTIPVDSLIGGLHTDHRIFFAGALAVRIFDAKLASVHLELPIAGVPSQGLRFFSGTTIDHLSSLYVTPAIRVKLLPGGSFSPWGSVGGGWAHYSLDSGSTTNKGAIEFGGGVDIKTGLPLLALRAEVRDFLTGNPNFSAILSAIPANTVSGLHRHNVLAGGGIVLRF